MKVEGVRTSMGKKRKEKLRKNNVKNNAMKQRERKTNRPRL